MTDYAEFLDDRRQRHAGTGFEPVFMPDFLFGFQSYLTDWAIRQGRAAAFADCGLGKSAMSLVWAVNVRRHTGRPVLLVTPLAVSFQFVAEAQKFGIDAAISRDGKLPGSDVVVTNYERLEHFNPDDFGGVVCDESSAIKAFDGKRRRVVTEFLRTVPYRSLWTATAAPNDYTELGTSSEALGYLGHQDMLTRFFTNRDKAWTARTALQRGTTNRPWLGGATRWKSTAGEMYRFKGHAEDPFWRWVASWARALRRPSDVGYDDTGYELPPLVQNRHVVEARTVKAGTLFDVPAHGLSEEREEARRTLAERCETAADLLADADPGIAWCQLNDESALLAKLIDGAVEVTGSDPPDAKEEKLLAFTRGEIRVLVIKPKIGAWGLNWAHCHRMTYFPSHSFEQHYQAVRRCWRFGQEHPVTVDVVTTTGGERVFANLDRKAKQADAMFTKLVGHMNDALGIQREIDHNVRVEVPTWVG